MSDEFARLRADVSHPEPARPPRPLPDWMEGLPQSPPPLPEEPPEGELGAFRAVPIEEFVAVDEASAEPLLGDADNTVLPRDGLLVIYGDGGVGKTTLVVDLAFHLAAGVDWLGLPVPGRCRVLVLENEGPRGMFRRKLRAKRAAWEGPSVDCHLHVYEHPWGAFSLDGGYGLAALAAFVAEQKIDVLVAGPVQTLGIEGGGTPSEVRAFARLLAEVPALAGRELAAALVHHENKLGGVSGAWGGVPDTTVHVRGRGHGSTAVEWEKARWASALHGTSWRLLWREGESFAIDETPGVSDDDVREAILAFVGAEPGTSWRKVEVAIPGSAERGRETRDDLLAEGALVDRGVPKRGRFYLPADDSAPRASWTAR